MQHLRLPRRLHTQHLSLRQKSGGISGDWRRDTTCRIHDTCSGESLVSQRRTRSLHAKLANADTRRLDSGFGATTAHGGSTASALDYAQEGRAHQLLLLWVSFGTLTENHTYAEPRTYTFSSSVAIFTVGKDVRIFMTPPLPAPRYVAVLP